MEQSFEVWFDFASTYSYPAIDQLVTMSSSGDLSPHWRPFLLGAIFKQQGWTTSPFNHFAAKGRYMWRDIERLCEARNLPFRRPGEFPRNSLHAARIAVRFDTAPWITAFIQDVFHANFADDRDIGDVSVLEDVLDGIGQPGREIMAESVSQEAKRKLRAQTARAQALGIFGAPTVSIGEELFWGSDRLQQAVAWYREHAETSS